MENSFAITTTFITYLLLMLGIGIVAYQRTKSSSDYFLGGRTLGPWPAALSAGASDMSGWLLLGLPGYAYASGIEAFWLAGGLLVGTWLNWLINAKRLRTYSITTNALTLPEFLSRRFNDKSKLIQVISAFFILLFFLFYTSSGLVAGGVHPNPIHFADVVTTTTHKTLGPTWLHSGTDQHFQTIKKSWVCFFTRGPAASTHMSTSTNNVLFLTSFKKQ